jgi:O-acetylserine/cysteine efflux transporter
MSFKDIWIAIFVQAVWAIGFTLCKPAMNAFPPLMTTTIIYFVVAVCLAPLAKPLKTPFGWMLLISILAGSAQTSLILSGLHLLPAILANLLMQLTMPFAIIISWLFRDERPSVRGVLGCGLALLGVGIVIGWPDQGGSWLGVGFMIAGAMCWAVAQNLIRHHGVDDGLSLYAGLARWSVPQMLLISLLMEANHASYVVQATWADWALIVALGITGFAGAYALWYRLLARNRIDHLLPFTLLMVPIGVASSVLLLGETLYPSLILGGTIVVGGLAIIHWRRREP